MTLPGGREFYRRWCVEAGTGPVAVTLHFSFSPGFTEQTIHVRGSLASATVDLERNTYLLHQHTRYGLDFDRYQMISREAASLRSQARRSLGEYGLSKLKLSTKGNPYGLSITRAVQSFYAGLGKTLDDRLSPELGPGCHRPVRRDRSERCRREGYLQGVNGLVRPLATSDPGTAAPADILLLGATGFIGQELARQLLAAGHRIRILVRNPGKLPEDLQGPNVDVLTGDLTRPEDLRRAVDGSRIVYHLARANVKTWDEFVEQDIEVTRRVAEACLSSRVQRLIYTGTIDSYYAGSRAGTITEATPLDPRIAWRNLYARAKAASEDILLSMHRERGSPGGDLPAGHRHRTRRESLSLGNWHVVMECGLSSLGSRPQSPPPRAGRGCCPGTRHRPGRTEDRGGIVQPGRGEPTSPPSTTCRPWRNMPASRSRSSRPRPGDSTQRTS